MKLFDAVKDAVTTREAAEHYGIAVDRTGKACCIFHDDNHPSMKVDDRYHCFACGADGDVIDFTAQLFGISLKDAAERLAADFNIPHDYERKERSLPPISPIKVKRSLLQRLKTYQNENYRALCSYIHLLRQWEAEYSPKHPEDEWHPLFMEAIQNSARVEYLLDELQGCSPEEAKALIADHKNEIARYASRAREFKKAEKQAARDLVR